MNDAAAAVCVCVCVCAYVCVMLVKYPQVEMVHFNLPSYVNNLIPDKVKLEHN
jgi:hypothetical protein